MDALIFYTARQQNIKDSDVRCEVFDTLNIASFDMMTEEDFLTDRAAICKIKQINTTLQ